MGCLNQALNNSAQVYERVRISLVEVNESVGKSVILGVELKAQKS